MTTDVDTSRTPRFGRALTPQVARQAAAVATGLAGVVHLAQIPAHRAGFWLVPLLFTLVGGGQLWCAVMAWSSARRRLLLAGLVVNLAALFAWFASRTSGLPFGPHAGTPEAVGVADLATAVAEAVAVATATLTVLAASRREPAD